MSGSAARLTTWMDAHRLGESDRSGSRPHSRPACGCRIVPKANAGQKSRMIKRKGPAQRPALSPFRAIQLSPLVHHWRRRRSGTASDAQERQHRNKRKGQLLHLLLSVDSAATIMAGGGALLVQKSHSIHRIVTPRRASCRRVRPARHWPIFGNLFLRQGSVPSSKRCKFAALPKNVAAAPAKIAAENGAETGPSGRTWAAATNHPYSCLDCSVGHAESMMGPGRETGQMSSQLTAWCWLNLKGAIKRSERPSIATFAVVALAAGVALAACTGSPLSPPASHHRRLRRRRQRGCSD